MPLLPAPGLHTSLHMAAAASQAATSLLAAKCSLLGVHAPNFAVVAEALTNCCGWLVNTQISLVASLSAASCGAVLQASCEPTGAGCASQEPQGRCYDVKVWIEELLALQRIAPQLARSIGAGSPALVDCMQALPGGAEPLMLSMLMVLTGNWLCCSYDTLLPVTPQKSSLDSLVMCASSA